MKNLILSSTLALCACAAPANTVRQSIAGEWKGVVVKEDARTMTEVQSSGREPRVTFWGSEITPISPEDVGRPAAVEVHDPAAP